jgi:CRISPR-associated protein Cas2
LTVIVIERASPKLRGLLTRWMVEVRVGVYVGTLSSRVRERLWSNVCAQNGRVGSVLAFSARNEQQFELRVHGDPSREVVDLDGLLLTRTRHNRG